jgi:carbamoyl-phosphate synthase large subunit
MRKVNILLTGVGAPGTWGTIMSLQKLIDYDVSIKIIGTDIQENPIGKYFVNQCYTLPEPENNTYISELLNIVDKEDIQIILPQTTRELFVLSGYKQILKEKNVGLLCSGPDSIMCSNNKYEVLKAANKLGLPTPKFTILDSLDSLDEQLEGFGYPDNNVVIKPTVSNGMRGVRVLTEKVDAYDLYLNEKPNNLFVDLNYMRTILSIPKDLPQLILMEYLPGQEYTVDMYRDVDDIVVIPRKRVQVRSGISFETQIDLRDDIIHASKVLAKELNLTHCFGFQFKLNNDQIPMLLECNPRVQGTMVASCVAGCNIILKSVLNHLKIKNTISQNDIIDGAQYKRYWGGVSVNGGEVVYETINMFK